MFNWWFQKLGGSEPTPHGLALTFEFVRSKKGSFYDENTKNDLVALRRSKNQRKHHLRIQEGHFLKSALNLDLTLPDDGECRTFFDSPRNYWFRCILRRVMVILRQQKNFGPNVRYCVFGYHGKHFTKHKPWFMFVNSSYIVSFVVKSPSRGKNPWKTAPANPRMSLFEKCFKSWFDTVRWWGMSYFFWFAPESLI